jgi:UDP-N-acetylmuramoyl-tripeptide--D-alanyl-D-alanine ligase
MSPHEVRGVTFVRDDWKAPLWTLEATQDFLRAARASRRIAVIGTVSDYAGHASKKYRALARKFLDVAELTLFVGPMAHCVERVAAEAGPDRLRMFARSYDARAFLAEALRPGDLVLLKGSVRADHLPRLVADYAGERVRCWREQCGKPYYCDVCRHRRSDFVPPPA